MILKGFNSEVSYNGEQYHVQTEDLMFNNSAKVVTQVFKDGAIIKSVSLSYADKHRNIEPNCKSSVVMTMMRKQHHGILNMINSGKLDS